MSKLAPETDVANVENARFSAGDQIVSGFLPDVAKGRHTSVQKERIPKPKQDRQRLQSASTRPKDSN